VKKSENMKNRSIDRYVALAKDILVLLRDGAIIILAVLLIAFPIKFNSILVEAGFEEGSIVGFKWKSKLREATEALEKANNSIVSLNDQKDQVFLALEEANKQVDDTLLKETLKTLQSQSSILKRETDAVQSDVLDVIASNEPMMQNISTASNERVYSASDYTVGLQSVGISDKVRSELNRKISEKGYKLDNVTYSYETIERPSWFALVPTVFYYSSSSQAQAESLSELMTRLTGKNFVVRRGGGLGVDPSKKHLTFFVHYIA